VELECLERDEESWTQFRPFLGKRLKGDSAIFQRVNYGPNLMEKRTSFYRALYALRETGEKNELRADWKTEGIFCRRN